jgi:hypothetical protein
LRFPTLADPFRVPTLVGNKANERIFDPKRIIVDPLKVA